MKWVIKKTVFTETDRRVYWCAMYIFIQHQVEILNKVAMASWWPGLTLSFFLLNTFKTLIEIFNYIYILEQEEGH